jgi:hypothetical protein
MVWVRFGLMNIHCEWRKDAFNDRWRLVVLSGVREVAFVEGDDDPVLCMLNFPHPALTFGEIEYIMDNWVNMPKPA